MPKKTDIMKNAIKILICSFLGMFSAHSQEVTVKYSMLMTFEDDTSLGGNTILRSKKNLFSLYEFNNESLKFKDNGSDNTFAKGPFTFWKDFSKQNIISITAILSDFYFVEDSLKLFDWKITKNSKEILGYKCQEATCEHQGRKFVAYFAKEIPISDGPWKFNGLPGLILSIKSIDNYVSFEAEGIQFSIDKEIKNPFKNRKIISFAEFKKTYIKAYNKLLNHRDYREDGASYSSIQIGKGGIELYVD